MKKRDWIAAVVILAAAVLVWLVLEISRGPAAELKISVDGETYGTYSLKEDREISVNDTNVCQIQDGEVRMIKGDCPDQICVHTAAISKEGGSIICLPNRVILEITSGS